ncbi:hypothetical protein BD770DRAFT_409326 [Pilaira anomala]|nr:hypothetical protein BD770DRAFT_409326 [Pilaira anomala]
MEMRLDQIGKKKAKRVEVSASEWSVRKDIISELKYQRQAPAGKDLRFEVKPPIPDTWTNRFPHNSRPSNQPIYSEEQIVGYEIKDEESYVSYDIPRNKHDGKPYKTCYCNESKIASVNTTKHVVKSNVSVFGDLSITDSKGSQTFQRLPNKLIRCSNLPINPIENEQGQLSLVSQERKKTILQDQDKKTWVCCHCTKNCRATEKGGHCITKTHLDYLEAKIICPACLHQSKIAQEKMSKKVPIY